MGNDETRFLELLKDWHRWAANFAEAPSRVECTRCNKLIGMIHEPDAVRLPDKATYSLENAAYFYGIPRYADSRTVSKWEVQGNNFNQQRESTAYHQGAKAAKYRLGLPCRLICPYGDCNHITVADSPKYRYLSELRKLEKRVRDEARQTVEQVYQIWHSRIGGRAIPTRNEAPDWPYAPAKLMNGRLYAEDVREALKRQSITNGTLADTIDAIEDSRPKLSTMRGREKPSTEQGAQLIDAWGELPYTDLSSPMSSIRGCYRYE